MRIKKPKLKKQIAIALILAFTTSSLMTIFSINGSLVDIKVNDDDMNLIEDINDELRTSTVYSMGSKYDLNKWWDTTWRFRIGLEIENPTTIDEYEPVEIYLTFTNNEYYAGTERLVSYNASGDETWSNALPVQVWNETFYANPNYVQSCSITFLANVSALSNVTYFFHYNENDDGIDTNLDYNTGFSSAFPDGETLSVNVGGDTGADYKVVLKEGSSVKTLEKDGINYHSPDSLAPEKQLSVSSLKFLAHLDETSGTAVIDASGNEPDGSLWNDIGGEKAHWTSGIVNNGLDFETSEPGDQWVSFDSGLEGAGEPFSDSSTAWTMTCWIKPESISSTAQTNHGTRNCFMAKASDPKNDNFEIGINNDGTIHVYLDTDNVDTQVNFPGTVNVGEWNFISLVFDLGKASQKVELRVNDNWYYSSTWDSAIDMDQAVGSPFTIGGSEHTDQSWDGIIDEVALYGEALSHEDIESYKYCSSPSIIQEIREVEVGQVFSQYEVDWTTTFNMQVSDICTFYYDLNVWNINRSIYFENAFDGESDLAKMVAMNSYFNFSQINDHDQCYLVYDGNYQQDITNTAGLTAENYTIIYNEPDASDDAIGLFITNYTLTSPGDTSVSYFNGSINYFDDAVMFTPGSNTDFENGVGGSPRKIIINFWEYCDSVQFVSGPELIWKYDNLSLALKTDLNVYIYEQDSLFYNIEVYVEDHDGRPVPEATVTIWNATDTSINWSQDTDETGWTTFRRFSNDTFVINASYVRLGQTLSITTSKDIIDLGDLVDAQGVYQMNFLDVSLTSVVLNCSRYYQSTYREALTGAKLNFTFFNDGASVGEVLSGYETTNSTGATTFRWTNTTSGNVSISIQWYDDFKININTDPTTSNNFDGIDPTKINVDFTDYTWHNVSVDEGREFETFLDLYDSDNKSLVDISIPLRDSFTIYANYSSVENGTLDKGLVSASVSLNLKIGTQVINENPLSFTELSNGYYQISINTANLIDGGESWLSSTSYTAEITASKPGFDSATNTTDITLTDLVTRLTANETETYVNWLEILTFRVHYEYNNSGVWTDVTGAQVSFYELHYPEISESFSEVGNGWYELSINTSTYFSPGAGDYDLIVTADLQNYGAVTINHDLVILEIRTFLNDTDETLDPDYTIYLGETSIFYFKYTEAVSGSGIANAQTMEFDWSKKVNGVKIAAGKGVSLSEIGSGIYALDFNTKDLEVAKYRFEITIKKNNFEERNAIIDLYVEKRVFSTTATSIYTVVSGNSLTVTLCITDAISGDPIDDIALENINMTFLGQTFQFNDDPANEGCYYVVVSNIPSGVFFLPEVYTASINIGRENYTTAEISVTVNVGMVEVFPGMPMFWFLMLVGAIAAVAGSLILNYYVQQKRIPEFVKKGKTMMKAISSNNKISDSMIYPAKDKFIAEMYADDWKTLELSIEDQFGIEKGKKRPLSDAIKKKSDGGAK